MPRRCKSSQHTKAKPTLCASTKGRRAGTDMEDGNRKRKKPSGCCNSRTARRVSENTDCNCVNFNREASETQVFSLKFLKSDGGKKILNTSSIKNFDELPLFLNAQLVSRTLGVSPSSAYELLHEDGFPSLRIGSRLVVPKEQFRLWVERQTGGTHEE